MQGAGGEKTVGLQQEQSHEKTEKKEIEERDEADAVVPEMQKRKEERTEQNGGDGAGGVGRRDGEVASQEDFFRRPLEQERKEKEQEPPGRKRAGADGDRAGKQDETEHGARHQQTGQQSDAVFYESPAAEAHRRKRTLFNEAAVQRNQHQYRRHPEERQEDIGFVA